MQNFTCLECNITQDGSAIHHTLDGSDLCEICADVQYVACRECCGSIHRNKVEYEYNSEALCGECKDSDYTECADCSELLHTDNDACYNNDSGEPICEGCSESYCYDELTDETISIDNAVMATHIARYGQIEITTHSDNATCINGDYYTENARDDLFISCEGCGEYIDREEVFYTEDYCYCDGCYPGDESNGDINWKSMGDDIDGITFNDCTSTRRYGVEIECINASDSSHNNDTVFESKYDGSLDYSGCEFVSPVLQGDEGFEELRKMCKILSYQCAGIDNSCGLHIHIDLSDFNEVELSRLFYFIQKLEPISRKFVAKNRTRNSFCDTSLAGLDFKTKYKNGFFQGLERYSAYNFSSYNHHKTLEIRLHQGTIDYDDIRNWISLHLAIVDYVKRRESSTDHTEKTIRELLPIIARDVSEFYANKREQYHPMTSEERAVESARESFDSDAEYIPADARAMENIPTGEMIPQPTATGG